MEFSYASSQHAISIAMCLEAEAVSLYVTNSVDPHAVAAFQQTIERLLTEDIDTLYMENSWTTRRATARMAPVWAT